MDYERFYSNRSGKAIPSNLVSVSVVKLICLHGTCSTNITDILLQCSLTKKSLH